MAADTLHYQQPRTVDDEELTSKSVDFFELILTNGDLSVRATNALKALQAKPEWSTLTLDDFYKNKARFFWVLARLKHVGALTVSEVKGVVLGLTSDPNKAIVLQKQTNRLTPEKGTGERERRASLPFFQTILQTDISTRLRNVLGQVQEEYEGANKTLQDYIEDVEFREHLMKQPSVGRKTRDELFSAVENAINTANPNGPSSSDADTQPLQVNPIPPPWIIVDRMLAELKSRDADILRQRLGFGQLPKQTLEQLGCIYGVTRERIRQIERATLTKLRRSQHKAILDQSVSFYAEFVWATLGGRSSALFNQYYENAEISLSAETMLALTVSCGSLDGWLKTVAIKGKVGWFKNEEAERLCSRVLTGLNDELVNRAKPFPISSIKINGVDKEYCSSILQATGWFIYKDYVLEKKPNVRPRRTIRLHRIIAGLGGPSIPLHRLVEIYTAKHPDDQCSGRDILIVMEEAPQLFLRIMENMWTATSLPRISVQSGICLDTQETVVGCSAADQGDEHTVVSAIEQVLREYGPCRFVDLRSRALSLLPNDISASSVGPVLLISGRFVRLAPGIYGMPAHIGAASEGTLKIEDMFTISQCRIFIEAMRAGCTLDDFPAWSWRYELELCRWAENSKIEPALYSSLLEVITPEKWNGAKGDREYWERAKRLNASYLIDVPTPNLLSRRPLLSRVLAAIYYVIYTGSINWITINRILGKRLNDSGSASFLVVLIKLGAISPESHWQAPHYPTDETTEWYSFLSGLIEQHGVIDWDNAHWESRVATHRVTTGHGGAGWLRDVDSQEMERLFTSDRELPSMDIDEDDDISLEALLSIQDDVRSKMIFDSLSADE